jgi:hypothetical protein
MLVGDAAKSFRYCCTQCVQERPEPPVVAYSVVMRQLVRCIALHDGVSCLQPDDMLHRDVEAVLRARRHK